ncbi:putative transposase [Purpureocillium lavendulum]|uniref:Transposase n=1 Tax=Purpureocillium lavendulum TaxID=1247861 RepID=A0AB34FIY4_9HYPO|nr:putative transposase [Purpureocillium lavendulum]
MHGIKDPGRKDMSPPSRTGTLAEHFGVTAAPTDQRIFSTILGRVKLGAFEELLVDWIIHDNIPFRIVESERLRRLIKFVNPIYKDKIPSSAVLRSRLLSIYNGAKGAVTEHLKTARSKIHITFDGWTSRSQLSLLGVNCFFVDYQWQHRRLLLALPAVSGRHTGDNLANEVADVLADWDLGNERLGYMVLDNASNNDTAMAALGDEFGFDPEERRLRCLGHVINLAVKQLMFGEAADAVDHAYFNRIVEKAGRAWDRSKRKLAKPTMLDDKLSEEDWDVVEVFIHILRPFDEISVRLQGNPKTSEDDHVISGSFWEYFPSFEYLLAYLEELKQGQDLNSGLDEESAAMVTSHVNLAWMKLNEYYSKLWPVAYIGAVVLHPCFGWPALKYHWEGHAAARRWEEDYSARLAKLWREEYADHEFPGLVVNLKASGGKMLSGYDAFLAQSLGKRKRVGSDGRAGNASAPVDEYERYLYNFAPADDKY